MAMHMFEVEIECQSSKSVNYTGFNISFGQECSQGSADFGSECGFGLSEEDLAVANDFGRALYLGDAMIS
jgi:hypothetical protein